MQKPFAHPPFYVEHTGSLTTLYHSIEASQNSLVDCACSGRGGPLPHDACAKSAITSFRVVGRRRLLATGGLALL